MRGSSLRSNRCSPTSPRSSYVGARQPHKSRRGRILNINGQLPQTDAIPGPGAYLINKAEVAKSPRSPRANFGTSLRFNESTISNILLKFGTPIPLIIRPALGRQVISTRRSLGSASIGKGTRRAATLSATRKGTRGIDSPGPIYHPIEDSRDMEKRLGVRPTFSARQRMFDFQTSLSMYGSSSSSRSSSSSSQSDNNEFKKKKNNRPSTAGMLNSSQGTRSIRHRLDSEISMDLGYDRPGTSFGKARRPPLYSKDKGNIPGPKYENIQQGTDSLSTEPRSSTVHFGSSTRDQRKKIRSGVGDTDALGRASPGPGAYFTGGAMMQELAERNTRNVGPAFSIRARTPVVGAIKIENESSNNKYDLRARPSTEEMERWLQPDFSKTRKKSPRHIVGLNPRFGPVAGFSAGKR